MLYRRRELDGSEINKHHALTALTARKDSCCSLGRKVWVPCAAANLWKVRSCPWQFTQYTYREALYWQNSSFLEILLRKVYYHSLLM